MIEFMFLAILCIVGCLVLGALEFFVQKATLKDSAKLATLSMIPTLIAAGLLVIFF